ncbi:MAG: hypothetical protein FJ298_07545 [Planctomycetes bacterium]|nr:hypothetical protein [Planctomycetota bacterium]
MTAARSEEWFGRRRPWLWLSASIGVAAALAALAWWCVVRSAHGAVEAERARIGVGVSLCGGRTQAPAPDALARWIEVFVRTPPQGYVESQWPDVALDTAPGPYESMAGIGFLAPRHAALEVSFAAPEAVTTECSAAKPEQHLASVEGWLAEFVAQPATDPQVRDCLRALLRQRVLDEAHRVHALAARELPRADGAIWLARMELADEPLPQPALHTAAAVVRHLGLLAALGALEQDAMRARSALEAAHALCDSLAGLPWHDAYVTWVECELMALNATAAVLAHAPEAIDEERLVLHLDGLDAQGRHVAACELQRTLCDRAYARLLAGKPCGVEAFDQWPAAPGLRAPWLERERADALASWRRCADWSREPLDTRGAPPAYERHALASDDLATAWLAATRPVSNAALARLESYERVLRIALIARRDGSDAAQAEADRRAASAGGRSILVRSEPNGLLIETHSAHVSPMDPLPLRIYLSNRE